MTWLKPVTPTFNRSHPLARGCLAFWPFAEGHGDAADVVQGVRLAPQTNAGRTPTYHGPGGNCNADQTGFAVTAPSHLRPALPCTLAAVITLNGSPSASSTIWGIAFNNAAGSPFVAFEFQWSNDATRLLQLNWNSAGTFQSFKTIHAITSVSSVTPSVVVATFTASGRTCFLNGVPSSQSTGVSPPTYSATSTIGAGFYPGVTRNAAVKIHCAGIWNTAWTANDVAQFSVDPFAFVRPNPYLPRIFYSIPGVSAARGFYYRYLLGN